MDIGRYIESTGKGRRIELNLRVYPQGFGQVILRRSQSLIQPMEMMCNNVEEAVACFRQIWNEMTQFNDSHYMAWGQNIMWWDSGYASRIKQTKHRYAFKTLNPFLMQWSINISFSRWRTTLSPSSAIEIRMPNTSKGSKRRTSNLT